MSAVSLVLLVGNLIALVFVAAVYAACEAGQ